MADENGQNAIDELNGAEYDGRTLSVSVARPRTENEDRRGGGFHRGGNNNRGGGYGNRDNRDRNRY
jgi:RNA recognition motif-containing protein